MRKFSLQKRKLTQAYVCVCRVCVCGCVCVVCTWVERNLGMFKR